MSYKINKTNGELLVDLVDGQIDTTSTDITLIGRNYKGFGESVNENFIKLMENFAKTSAPGSPLVGQLWYDTAEERLKIYTGETFKTASGALVSQTQPNLVTGDIWIDSFNNKMYFYDGADIVLVGPQYNAGQGKTTIEASTVVDSTGKDQTVLYMYISGLLTGIYSRTEFRPLELITGFPTDPTDTNIPKRQIVKRGFNPVDTGFSWQGTALSTQSLINDAGEAFTEANFMKTDRDTSTLGSLAVKNENGLTVGVSDTVYAALRVDRGNSDITALETQQTNKNFVLRAKRSNAFDDVIYVNAALKRLGIYTSTPTLGFDVNTDARVNGDLSITGDLTVAGDSTFIQTQTLQVEDKNIELSINSSGIAAGDDTVADGGGITLKSVGGDKTLVWINATGSWTSNQSFNLTAQNAAYKIDGVNKLTEDRLDQTVLYAEGLVRVGTLQYLNVDNFNLNGATLTTTNPLNINSNGVITINNNRIEGVLTPISNRVFLRDGTPESADSSVATKRYVDEEIRAEPLVVSLDVTGYANPEVNFAAGGPYNNVKEVIQQLYPAGDKQNGTVAKVYCSSYSQTSVTGIDVDQLIDDPDNPGGPQISAVRKSYIAVDKDNVSSTESVLQDIEFLPVSASAGFIPDRAIMEFEANSGVWEWQRTTVLS
jgi:hypothetical protein